MSAQHAVESAGPVTLRETETYRVFSEHVGAELELRVARPVPGLMSQPVEEYAVLYVLDGDLFFGTATETTRLMHGLFGELPPLLVVGIGYGTNDPRLQGETRNRDFTPTADPAFEAMGRRMMPGWEPLLPEGRRMGGADRFLDFLEREVAPLLAERYPVAERGSTLFGSSMGGLLATYALLTRPGPFDHYVIASPALWWDGELLFRIEERVAPERDDLPAKAFLAAGSLEEGSGIPGLDRWKLVTNARTMSERLAGRRYPSLQVDVQVLEGETHTSAVPLALTRGLRWAFGGARG